MCDDWGCRSASVSVVVIVLLKEVLRFFVKLVRCSIIVAVRFNTVYLLSYPKLKPLVVQGIGCFA